MDAMKIETMGNGFEDMTEEEKRQEIIRLRDSLLDEIAVTQRVMAEYVKQAHMCTEMLREMDGKRVKPHGQKEDVTFDDGDDWDWGW